MEYNHQHMVIYPSKKIMTLGPTPQKSLVYKEVRNLLIPSSQYLLRSIEKPFQFAYIYDRSWLLKSGRLLHVDVLLQVSIDKCTQHINLMHLLSTTRSQSKHYADGDPTSHGSKGLGVVHALLLRESLSHQPSLIVLHLCLKGLIGLTDPPHHIPTTEARNQLLSGFPYKCIMLLLYGIVMIMSRKWQWYFRDITKHASHEIHTRGSHNRYLLKNTPHP